MLSWSSGTAFSLLFQPCIHPISGTTLEETPKITFPDSSTAELVDEDTIVIAFPQPVNLQELIVQTTDGRPLTATVGDKDTPLETSDEEPIINELPTPGVTSVTVTGVKPVESLTTLIVMACGEAPTPSTTTPAPEVTTPEPVEPCLHQMEGTEMSENPISFPDGSTAEIKTNPDNGNKRVVVKFPEPVDLSQVIAQTTTGEPLSIVPYTKDGKQTPVPVPRSHSCLVDLKRVLGLLSLGLSSGPEEKEGTDVPVEDVVKVVIRGTPSLEPEEIVTLNVIACVKPKTTTPSPSIVLVSSSISYLLSINLSAFRI